MLLRVSTFKHGSFAAYPVELAIVPVESPKRAVETLRDKA